jgi:GWxTD domain-containing protein
VEVVVAKKGKGKKAIIFLILLICLMPLSVRASEVELSLDALTFKSDSSHVYLELHIDLPRLGLVHKQEADGWYGAVKFQVWIKQDSLTLAQEEWRLEDLAADISTVGAAQRIVDARIYSMPPGEYDIFLAATDSLSGQQYSLQRKVLVEDYPEGKLSISHVQLASYLIDGSVHPRFDRGGFSIIPNPRHLFSTPGQGYYYFEIYPATRDTVSYRINTYLLNSARQVVREEPGRMKQSDEPFAVVDTFSIAGLPSGTYYFRLDVTTGETTLSRASKLFLMGEENAQLSLGPTIVDSVAVAAELAQVEFLLTQEQIKIAKNMNVAQKFRFLEMFWKMNDDDPLTPDVPLRRLFQQRVEEADSRFSNTRSAGHLTDRGRVYVVHGEPDERDAHPHDIDAKPWEVWNYRGGIVFAFVDRSGLGEFRLVHSNYRGEVENPNWYQEFAVRSGTETRK